MVSDAKLSYEAYPSCLVPLSYRLHAELAKQHEGEERWGYRRVNCGQLSAVARPSTTSTNIKSTQANDVSLQKVPDGEGSEASFKTGIPADLDWFSTEAAGRYEEMGNLSTTAQVHPYQFTTAMAKLAAEKGVKIILGRVIDIDKANGVKSVTYIEKETSRTETIPATDVVIAAGPWTRSIYPTAPIEGLRAHSVTIAPSRPISAYAIFTEILMPSSSEYVSPEIYARPNNEAYACGEGDTLVPLPSTTADVEVDQSRCQAIIDQVSSISDELRDGQVLVRQACYLPNVSNGMRGPLVGATGIKGLFIAAGHTCWGIQNGPGTGKLMSEFVFDGMAKSAKVASLDPKKFL